MKLENDARSFIRNAYPGRHELIELGLRDNQSFRELCDDYYTCATALEEWRGVQGAAYAERAREYETLLAELAEEIEVWLDIFSRGLTQSEDAVPE
jgi:hypothetical protein